MIKHSTNVKLHQSLDRRRGARMVDKEYKDIVTGEIFVIYLGC